MHPHLPRLVNDACWEIASGVVSRFRFDDDEQKAEAFKAVLEVVGHGLDMFLLKLSRQEKRLGRPQT